MRRRSTWLAVSMGLSFSGAAGCGRSSPGPASTPAPPIVLAPPAERAPSTGAPEPAPPAEAAEGFAVYLIDDAAQPFAETSSRPPSGVTLAEETVPFGPDAMRRVRFAQFERARLEPADRALERARGWLASIPLPSGARFLLQPSYATIVDAKGSRTEPSAWRSYVVTGERILAEEDLVTAELVTEPEYRYLAVSLAPAAAERFAKFTADHIKQRLAIVLDGQVQSAPVLVSKIEGGKLSLVVSNDAAGASATGLVERVRRAKP
ncbi:MAG: hypothetical protein U0263_30975 [Polyangiaceae bacterium]